MCTFSPEVAQGGQTPGSVEGEWTRRWGQGVEGLVDHFEGHVLSGRGRRGSHLGKEEDEIGRGKQNGRPPGYREHSDRNRGGLNDHGREGSV